MQVLTEFARYELCEGVIIMWDLTTIVRMNKEAVKKARAERKACCKGLCAKCKKKKGAK